MSLFPLKPTSSYVRAYYAALKQFHEHDKSFHGWRSSPWLLLDLISFWRSSAESEQQP